LRRLKSLKFIFLGASVLATINCTSKPKKIPHVDVVAKANCGTTPVNARDLEQFNFSPTPGKVTVVRVFRSTCPFCKEDILRMGEMFRSGKWRTNDIQILFMAYKKEGIESRQSFDRFVREDLNSFAIPLEATQMAFLDKTYPEILQTKSKSGEVIFQDWRAVPYGLVFGRDGRLVYRGHFTTSTGEQDANYKLIAELQAETCR
jgi:hypothetical protein